MPNIILLDPVGECVSEVHPRDALLRMLKDMSSDDILKIDLGIEEGLQIGEELEALLIGDLREGIIGG